jgi:hypothetical protein
LKRRHDEKSKNIKENEGFLGVCFKTFSNKDGEPSSSKHSKEEVHNNNKFKNIKKMKAFIGFV